MELVQKAFFWGIVSAISLPLGASIGLIIRPGRKITSALMAFGAGALLFALTIELFAEALEHAAEHGRETVFVTMVGAILGGLLFDLLNQILNNRGAFIRRLGITRKYIGKLKLITAKRVIHKLSHVTLLQALPPGEIVRLLAHMKREAFHPGTVIFREGEEANTLYFILSGEVEILRADGAGEERLISTLIANDTFGEMALLSDSRRTATARVRTPTRVLKVLYDDFDALLADSVVLQEAVQSLFYERTEDLARKSPGLEASQWKEECLQHLDHLHLPVTDSEIDEASRQAARSRGAALAIWLGIALDGIPESLIIGLLTASAAGISLAFIVGVFLANLPEAMSSAVGMSRSGMKQGRVLWMWISLCLLTGLGAVIGSVIFPAHPTPAHYFWILGIEGMAAGAMLTMIAETMLPEAYEQGGAIVGFSTLMGFLTALVVKIL